MSLTDEERMQISAVVHQNYYMPDVFAAVEQIVASRAQRCAYDSRGLCATHGSPTRHILDPVMEWPSCLAVDPPPEPPMHEPEPDQPEESA